MPRLFVARKLSLDPRSVVGPDVDVDLWDDELPPPRTELLARVARADGLLALLTERVDAELLDQAPSLRVVANHAVGVDNVDVPACTARGIWVTNTPDATMSMRCTHEVAHDVSQDERARADGIREHHRARGRRRTG